MFTKILIDSITCMYFLKIKLLNISKKLLTRLMLNSKFVKQKMKIRNPDCVFLITFF